MNSSQLLYKISNLQHSIRMKKAEYTKAAKAGAFGTSEGTAGTDDVASEEIDELLRWNIFKKEIIAVHGTMMDQQQAKKFKKNTLVANCFQFEGSLQ